MNNKVFKFIRIVGFVQCLLFILQYYTNFDVLLSLNIKEQFIRGESLLRIYARPILCSFFAFIYLITFLTNKKKKYFFLYMLFSFMIVLTASRGAIMSHLFCTLFISLFVLKKRGNVFPFIFLMLVPLIMTFSNNYYTERLLTGFDDIFKDIGETNYYEGSSTFNLRLALAYERFRYINDNNMYVFGLGFITEDSDGERDLNFKVGLKDIYGDIIQIDTGDIAWSLLILKLGFLGSIIFILSYLYILCQAYMKREFPMHLALLFYIINVIALSINSTNIINNIFIHLLVYSMVNHFYINDKDRMYSS